VSRMELKERADRSTREEVMAAVKHLKATGKLAEVTP